MTAGSGKAAGAAGGVPVGEWLSFDGRTVLVTGAGRAVGRAHALAFAGRGAAVVVNDLPERAEPVPGEGAEAVVAEIVAAGGRAVAHLGDVSDPAAAEAMVALGLAEFGRVDVVVANAGIDRVAPLRTVTPELLEEFFRVHVLGTWAVCSAAWSHFVAQKFGRIVTTTSSTGYFGLARALPYTTAKGALHGMTQTLALEGARHGINVNAVAPFATSRLARRRLVDVPAMSEAIEGVAPASAVSPVVLWLAHESTTVTGAAFEAGVGAVSRIAVGVGEGLFAEGELTPEAVRDNATLLTSDEVVVPALGAADRPLTRALADRAAVPST